MMSYTLSFTNKADKDEKNIYKHITDKFGEIYARKFRRNLIEFCHFLIRQPFIGRLSKNDETLRVFIFSKQNKIVYKVEDNNITIIRILSIKTNLSSKY
jgi:plasmid stabilization system protein ParE